MVERALVIIEWGTEDPRVLGIIESHLDRLMAALEDADVVDPGIDFDGTPIEGDRPEDARP